MRLKQLINGPIFKEELGLGTCACMRIEGHVMNPLLSSKKLCSSRVTLQNAEIHLTQSAWRVISNVMGENENGMFYNTLEHAATEPRKRFLQVCESDAVSKKCFYNWFKWFWKKNTVGHILLSERRQQSPHETTSSKLQSWLLMIRFHLIPPTNHENHTLFVLKKYQQLVISTLRVFPNETADSLQERDIRCQMCG